jgi:hypothetical protein
MTWSFEIGLRSSDMDREEKRSEPRARVAQFHSVEISLKETAYSYQFRIWNRSTRGICVVVKADSDLVGHIKEGDILTMKYYATDPERPIENLKTKIRHITKNDEGQFKGHYVVGLSILEKSDPASSDP